MSTKITHFPIKTTDKLADEDFEGLCSDLKSTLRPNLVYPEGTDSVVSEGGIRLGIDKILSLLLRGINLGDGEGVYRDTTIDIYHKKIFFNLKSFSTHTPDTVDIQEGPNGIQIQVHSGGVKFENRFVQGGSRQLFGQFFDDYSQKIKLKANYDAEWDSDLMIAKIGFCIKEESAFDNEGVIVWVGIEDTDDSGRLLLEEPLIDNYSFLLTECEDKILIYK
jgi:hypothetical protein